MKKIIIAALALVTFGFCDYTGNFIPLQVGIVEGCTDGTTAIAIQVPGVTHQYLVKSSQPFFGIASSYAQEAVLNGKYLNIEASRFNFTTYSFKYNGTCTAPGFYTVNSINLVR